MIRHVNELAGVAINGKLVLTFPADWRRYGKGAGPIRNKQMLEEGLPDEVWAFVDRPLGFTKGTANMVTQATNHGMIVRVFQVTDYGKGG